MDSIEERYKSWLDMGDDSFEVEVLLPAWKVVATPDTSRGDTLAWQLDTSVLADSTVILSAVGYTPIPATWIILGLVLLAGIIFLLTQRRGKP